MVVQLVKKLRFIESAGSELCSQILTRIKTTYALPSTLMLRKQSPRRRYSDLRIADISRPKCKLWRKCLQCPAQMATPLFISLS